MSKNPNWSALNQSIESCMLFQQHTFKNRIKKLRTRIRQNKPIDNSLAQIEISILKSQTQRHERKDNIPSPTYPEDLPISQKRDVIAEAIGKHQVTIIAGETGSGKTTQIPKICLELGRGIAGTIGHTQPRRIAARSVATRIAEELNSPMGKDVGYKIRFSDHTQKETYIKLMTDGILLAEIQHDPKLLHYDTIIIDEAHERSLNIDFLLGYLKNMLPKRPDLKIIITSATINTERFSKYFNDAPVIEVSGRSYPVDIEYRPLMEGDNTDDKSQDEQTLQRAIINTVDEAASFDALGDILIFLPGEREIRDVSHALHQHEMRNTEILPLFSRLSPAEQDKIFKTHTGRRIVLATNVAETSLTVPGIRFVIDAGLARISRYSPKSKVQQLPIEPISQASANQRAGRCGRVAAGVCFRLYSEENFANRPEHTDPEILRTNLAHVILQMINLGLGNIEAFPFMEPPEKRTIQDGYRLLEELQSINSDGRLTDIGKQLIRMPIDPRLGRMVVQAHKERSLHEVLIIVSALSVQDPKLRPPEASKKADEKHAIFTDKTSDFLSWVKLWNWYHEQSQHLSNSKLRKTCTQHYLSYMRMREWHDLHGQLLGIVRELKMQPNKEEAKPDEVHKAVLSGLLSHIATKQEDSKKKEQGFLGARNLQVTPFPGSPLAKKPPKWLMAASLVETSRLFARCIAPIDPTWLEPLAPDLIKRTYSEPHWSKKRAQVCAFETITLYGLPIISKRACHFGPIDPIVSREIFIRQALVMFEFHSFGRWFKHNKKLLAEIESLEAKSRRRDLMADEQTLFEHFDQLIPEGIYSGKLFEQWRKKEERSNPQILFLNKDILLHDENNIVDAGLYPNHLKMNGLNLKLEYQFDPTLHSDGISVIVPIVTLGQLETERFEWLVPGLLEEKITFLIKGLPKAQRVNFVPAPQYAKACVENMNFGEGSLLLALSTQLQKMTGVYIPTHDWQVDKLPSHLKTTFNIMDKDKKQLASSTDIHALKTEFAHLARQDINTDNLDHFKIKKGLTRWDFDAGKKHQLPEVIRQNKHGMSISLFPALEDKGESVDISLFESEKAANQAMFLGLRRLLMLTLHQQADVLRKNMSNQKQLALWYVGIGKTESLKEDMITQTFDATFLSHIESYPRNLDAFEALIAQGRADVVPQGKKLAQSTLEALEAYATLQHKLKQVKAAALAPVVQDIQTQISRLIFDGFVAKTPTKWTQHLARYLQACEIRLEKAGPNLNLDTQNTAEIRKLWQWYEQTYEQYEKHGQDLDDLIEFRWHIEELRVSLFAQSLKTIVPISIKRLSKQVDAFHR
ncbi:MAG: ATP-dependent RNA helicase HrpA [Ghiorsea sp.]